MRRTTITLVLVWCLVVPFSGAITTTRAQSQLPGEPLTNSDIVQMVSTKISADDIITKIKTSRCHFDTNPTVLEELRYKRVPEPVLVAMAEAPFGAPRPPRVEVPIAETIRKDAGSNASPVVDKTQRAKPLRSTLPQTTEASGAEPSVDVTSLSEDLQDEIALGYGRMGTLLSNYPAIRGTKEDNLAQAVLAKLRATAVVRNAPTLPYDVTIIERNDVNAFTTFGGHHFVTSAMARLLGDDAGLWAAVEGHELGHSIGRHVYKTYLRDTDLQRQIAYLRRRVASGDQSANWSLIAVAVAGRLLNNKMERNDENEADRLALSMMVEAGYHPDFEIALIHKLKAKTGDQSKFAALFSDHPRWATREERALKIYDEALARFESRWPDTASSPGGLPPMIATVGKVSIKQDKIQKGVVMQAPYSIRNAKGIEIDAAVFFSFKGNAVPSLNPQFQATDGSFVAIKGFMPGSRIQSGSMEIAIPSAAIGISERKLKARFCLINADEPVECSKEVDASFPKN